MTLLARLKECTRPGWRTEAAGLVAVIAYFSVVVYENGVSGVTDAPLFIQFNLVLVLGLFSWVAVAMIRLFKKGLRTGNRDDFILSALLAGILGCYFAVSDLMLRATTKTSSHTLINDINDICKYTLFAFALYALYRSGRR